jgi:hypothetical protein
MDYNLLVEGQSESAMSVLDEDLSFLATQAALELDMLMEGKEIELDAVPRLSIVMNGSFEPVQSEGRGSFLDPATATIVNTAFTDSKLAKSETVDELVKKALELAAALASQVHPDQRNGELADIKRFCLALARCSSAYRETVLGQRSKHPNRK